MAAPEDDEGGSPVYFWREWEPEYGCLSQWYECSFTHEGTTYTSTEMWMMAQKAELFGDRGIAQKVREASTPKEQKALGRQVSGFDREKWDAHKSNIVEQGNWLKFTESTESAKFTRTLLATGNRELVEASPTDRIWGIGYSAAKADANRERWGENLLGKALMSVRRRLREQSTATEKIEKRS